MTSIVTKQMILDAMDASVALWKSGLFATEYFESIDNHIYETARKFVNGTLDGWYEDSDWLHGDWLIDWFAVRELVENYDDSL